MGRPQGKLSARAPLRALIATTLGAALAGCSPAPGATPGSGGGTAYGGAGGDFPGGAPGGGGVPAPIGGGGNGMFNVAGTASNSGGGNSELPDGACGATTLKAEKIIETETEIRTETKTMLSPVGLYIMIDQSGSMIDKWGYAVQAIDQFVKDPASAGIDVGVHYFPLALWPCIPLPSDCTGSAFSKPEVAFGRLTTGGPGSHNQVIADNLLTHGPCGAGTPIEDALRGLVKGCTDFEAAHPGEDCIALLITDGAPSGCAEDQATLTGIAADGLAAGIETYTVGMPGADYNLLDAIATAGGSDCNGAASGRTCNASSGAEFAAALAAVRDTVTETIETVVEIPVEVSIPLDCEWELPDGEDTDINKVNVDFTDTKTGILTKLQKVPSQTDCAAFADGWYYDDPAKPTKLLACDAVCTTIKATEAKIDILVGCDTTEAVIK